MSTLKEQIAAVVAAIKPNGIFRCDHMEDALATLRRLDPDVPENVERVREAVTDPNGKPILCHIEARAILRAIIEGKP